MADVIVCFFPVKVGKFEQCDVELIRQFVRKVAQCEKCLFDDETEPRHYGNVQRSFFCINSRNQDGKTDVDLVSCIGSESLFYELSVC